jgi:two-component system sensor histidine kinase KdpD
VGVVDRVEGLARGSRGRRRAAGILLSLAALGLVTAAIYLCKSFVPVLSLGVLYLFAVLPVAVLFGRAYAVPVAIASAALFNFLFLPPLYTFRLSNGEHWFALAVYLVVGIVVSDLAVRARQRAWEAEQQGREEALLAQMATAFLQAEDAASELERFSPAIAEVLHAESARIVLGRSSEPPAGESPLELDAGGRRLGTLYVREGPESSLAIRRRFLPALASLIAVATDRERLARESLETEALRRSDTIKTAVLQAVSHDLRSPLTAIRVAAESLENPELSLDHQDRSELLETVRLEVERLERVVGNLLDLSRLQAGAAEPHRELWAIEELVAQALDQVGPGARRVEVALPADAPVVEVDAVQIERVLVNLLENALKFSPAGEPVNVRVKTTRSEVLVRVVDRGTGIPEADLERIFEPFSRAPESGERSGSGLGLAIAKGFAEGNGGRVWAESRQGQGASFVLALPLVEVPVEARA